MTRPRGHLGATETSQGPFWIGRNYLLGPLWNSRLVTKVLATPPLAAHPASGLSAEAVDLRGDR